MPTLRKAREEGKLNEFIAEHENDAPSDRKAFDATLSSMAGTSKPKPETSPPDCADD